MTLPVTGSQINLLQLSTLPPREPLRPLRKKQRQVNHRWAKEELNPICYLRLHRGWTWDQIQRTFFSSMSVGAVKIAFLRIPLEDRVDRASTVSSLIVSSRKTASASSHTRNRAIKHPFSRKEPSHSSDPVSGSTQPLINVGVDVLATSSPENRNSYITTDNITTRYNLRPNRPLGFRKSTP